MARVIAFYLPQFHPIKENDIWWGPGFTEWVSVATARKYYPGHKQPHIPADLGFYDLRVPEVRAQQAALAKEAGIEGFCYWHYWFGEGRELLERPFNEVLQSGEPDFPFCLAWANHSWYKKRWGKAEKDELLIEQKYGGDQDYIEHFNHLLPAFKDKRYMKVDGKPIFVIYDPYSFKDVRHFVSLWRKLAAENGLNDFYFIAKDSDSRQKTEALSYGFDAIYNEDTLNIHHKLPLISKVLLMAGRKLNIPSVFSYRKAIKYMVTEECRKRDTIPVIAPNWDHSPRSGARAMILHNPRPEYFEQLAKHAIDVVSSKPEDEQLIILKSWNEWGEGNYMEPDMEYGHGYINAMKRALGK